MPGELKAKAESDTSDFKDFLTRTHDAVQNKAKLGEYKKVHVVSGNESCDLDSVACALVYAYHLSKNQPEEETNTTLVLPILNIPEEDYFLKTEVKFALEEFDIHAQQLVFIRSADFKGLHRDGKLQLTLVDHHLPVGKFAGMEDCVMEVIDHRPVNKDHDQNAYLETVDSTIEEVGSCATLVAEKILNESDKNTLPAVCAYLLFETILRDTNNFGKFEQRRFGTDKDRQMAGKLERLSEALKPQMKRADIAEKLSKAADDVAGMSVAEMIRKDQKMVDAGQSRLLVCMVSVAASKCVTSIKDLAHYRQICADKHAEAVIVMGASNQEKKSKELFFYALDRHLLENLAKGLERTDKADLELTLTHLPFEYRDSGHFCQMYTQHNLGDGRKELLPAIQDILGGKFTKAGKVGEGAAGEAKTSASQVDNKGNGHPDNSLKDGEVKDANITDEKKETK